jgi:diguanylate cyclase (GGDEF)-like protein
VTPPSLVRLYGFAVDALLGTDAKLRAPVGRTLLGLGVYAACAALMLIESAFEGSDPLPVRWMTAYMLVGPVIFYLLIRGGWSLRQRDVALSLPQSLYAVSATALSYPLDGPMRGLNLLLVALLPFFGFLALRPRQVRLLAILSVGVFGSMMALLAWVDPIRFDPRIEVLHFVIAAVGLPFMALVLGQASRMRAKVKLQRTELQAAFERIESLATHDDLTGLVNRPYITRRLAEECARASRYGQLLCVVMIDLDHFKRINDTFGHAQGDEVLRHFARIGTASLLPGAELARWGGEEFLLLPAFKQEAAVAQVDAVRAGLADAGNSCGVAVTFSAGLACDLGAGSHDMMERADRALYLAKNEGRNRTAWL